MSGVTYAISDSEPQLSYHKVGQLASLEGMKIVEETAVPQSAVACSQCFDHAGVPYPFPYCDT